MTSSPSSPPPASAPSPPEAAPPDPSSHPGAPASALVPPLATAGLGLLLEYGGAAARESLLSIKRAGADLVLTYFAEDVARTL